MIYCIEHNESQEFEFCNSVQTIVDNYESLKTKHSTINKRFNKLQREKKLLIIKDWGYTIKKAKRVSRSKKT